MNSTQYSAWQGYLVGTWVDINHAIADIAPFYLIVLGSVGLFFAVRMLLLVRRYIRG